MLFALLATAVASTTIVEAIVTGVGLGAGLYCASRTQKTSSMPKAAR